MRLAGGGACSQPLAAGAGGRTGARRPPASFDGSGDPDVTATNSGGGGGTHQPRAADEQQRASWRQLDLAPNCAASSPAQS